MSVAWKRGGEKWSAVRSRIITARLLIGAAGSRLSCGRRRRSDFYLFIVSVYAPTSKAPPAVKQRFVNHLQEVIARIPPNDVLLVWGDFNARVGSRHLTQEDTHVDGVYGDSCTWGPALGPFGLGSCYRAGEDLLMFCAMHQLYILNTWFKKNETHRGTWAHPATKRYHMIDFILMLSSQ